MEAFVFKKIKKKKKKENYFIEIGNYELKNIKNKMENKLK